jgi:hypothetical protein
MNEFQATAVIVMLFILRCVVPLLLLLAVGHGMNRLAARWEREEATQAASPRPAAAARPPEPLRSRIPCWLLNNCDERTRTSCPAYVNHPRACWAARAESEGRLPARCSGCPLYPGEIELAGLTGLAG